MPISCSALVRQIYYSGQASSPVLRAHVRLAFSIVDRLYPPACAEETFALLAALNLLNTAVKRSWGRRMVCYNYVKGMAGLLFESLVSRPIDGVHIYHAKAEHVTYFKVMDVQLSFHYVPLRDGLAAAGPVQRWDGMRLQLISVEVLRLACWLLPSAAARPCGPTGAVSLTRSLAVAGGQASAAPLEAPPEADRDIPAATAATTATKKKKKKKRKKTAETPRKRKKQYDRQLEKEKDYEYICWERRCFREYKLGSLEVALHFSPWRTRQFTLLRRKDSMLVRFIHYNGTNYDDIVDALIKSPTPIPPRSPRELFSGLLYYITPKMRLRAVLESEYLRLLTQHNYLCGRRHRYYNLLVTYDIALFLTAMFPKLRVACTLVTNRYTVANRLFSHAMMLRIPQHSRMRRLKVWLVYDPWELLRDFNMEQLPAVLVEGYLAAPDYYQEYEITQRGSHQGLYAYRRHHLLKPVYRHIDIVHYHARVQRDDGLWAIYSLHAEQFVTNFVYTAIWYDRREYILYGETNDGTTVVYDFFNPQSRNFY